MAEAGILHEGDRVEHIEGKIIDLPPIGSLHVGIVKRLTSLFMVAMGKNAIVSGQDPVRLARYSQPQPDIALLRPREDDYTRGHPGPGDALRIVVVTPASPTDDLEVKVPLHVHHARAEVWVPNAESSSSICRSPGYGTDRQVHIQSRPCTPSPLLPQISLKLSPLTS